MKITRQSRATGKWHEMDLPITAAQIERRNAGALVQEAFPNLTAAQREFIISGTTDEEWKALFGSDDEPEDDCAHEWAIADRDDGGDGRCYCLWCGADGDG